jgi:hypothetical protein
MVLAMTYAPSWLEIGIGAVILALIAYTIWMKSPKLNRDDKSRVDGDDPSPDLGTIALGGPPESDASGGSGDEGGGH